MTETGFWLSLTENLGQTVAVWASPGGDAVQGILVRLGSDEIDVLRIDGEVETVARENVAILRFCMDRWTDPEAWS